MTYVFYSAGVAGIVILYMIPALLLNDHWINALVLPESAARSFSLFCVLSGMLIYPLTGMLMDRATSTGRLRLRKVAVFLACAAVSSLLFIQIPKSAPLFLKYLWGFGIYFLYSASFPLIEIPHLAMMSAVTTDYRRRGALAAWRQTVAVIAALICQVTISTLSARYNGSIPPKAYPRVLLPIAAVAFLLYLLYALGVKKPASQEAGIVKPTFSAFIFSTRKNAPMTALMACALCWGIADGFGADQLFFKFYIHNLEAYKINAILRGGAYVFSGALVIFLARYIPNKRNIGILSWIISLCALILQRMCPLNLTWGLYVYQGLAPLRALFGYAGFIIVISLVPDARDYALDMFNIRAGSFISGMVCLFWRLGAFAAHSVFNQRLSALGFFRSVVIYQPAPIVNWIRICAIPLPAFFTLAGILFLRMYKLNEISHDLLLARRARDSQA